MTVRLKRMITVPSINRRGCVAGGHRGRAAVVPVAVFALLAGGSPALIGGTGHQPRLAAHIQAAGSNGWSDGGALSATRSRRVAYRAPSPRDEWRLLSSRTGVTLHPVTAVYATGAALSWAPYVNKTGAPGNDLASYQVHRSRIASFVPSAGTLVAPVAAGVTSFTDTSATPASPGSGTAGAAYYYMIAVKTKDGGVIPGKVQAVRLPTAGSSIRIIRLPEGGGESRSATVTSTEPTAQNTYYVPSLPDTMASGANYVVPVTLTNTTTATWAASDWVLSYHWLLPDGTDVSAASDRAQTALPADMAPGAVATVNATVTSPVATEADAERAGYQIAWDLYNKTTGTWLSSGTSTPDLTAAAPAAGTVPVLAQATSVQQSSSDLLGLEQYFQYTGVGTGGGTSLLNNDATGNVVWNDNVFSNPSRGFQTFVRLDYNSMDTSESAMGFGWSLQTSTLQRLGTPLDFQPPGNPRSVTLTDGDGTTHTFTLDTATNSWVSPPGLHYLLQNVGASNCSPNGKVPAADAWSMTAPDGTVFDFDCNGYQTSMTDRNGNTATFTYTDSNSDNSPREFLDYITDSEGRQTLTIDRYAKGGNYDYIDPNGNVASGTGLTNPDIIDQVQSITDISGRTIEFLYNVQGEMAQMTDGFGTPVAKTYEFAYDMTQGNKNVKLVSVTDPDGNTTHLTYYTAPQDPKFKWSLETITDPMNRSTGFAYSEPSGGGIQTVVTDPKGNATTYLMDTSGRPVQSANALNQVTKLAWDSDNNVTSLTEPNGAQSTWTYDPDTGYPLTKHDAQANHDGTAGTTYAYQTSLSGHVASLIGELTPQQRLWTFGYDANGNVTSVTRPLGNVSGAAAGSYTTRYTYDSFGDQLTSTDANGNTTGYSGFDPTGYPTDITDPACYAQRQASPQATCKSAVYSYDARGNVLSVTDPLQQGTATYAYDVFGRPLSSTVPETSTESITTPAPLYDGDDNITQSTTPDGAVTTYSYDADGELTSKATPPDTSSMPSPTATFTYDADGNLATETAPDGNVSGAPAGSFTTAYGYDATSELTSVTSPLGGVTKYGYDSAGNKTSVTDPDGNQTQSQYNLNHQVTQTANAAGNTTQTAYDLDGDVVSTTDQNGNTTLYTLDADGQVTQQQVPAQAPGAPVTYDTTQYTYDQDGNQTQVVSPRGVASGIANAYTTQTEYTADNQVSAVLTQYLPGDPVYGTPAQTSYSYDADGRLTSVTAPASNGSSSAPNVTSYQYLDNGWVKQSTDPTGIVTKYGYNQLGEQISREIDAAGGNSMSRSENWGYYPDGKLASVTDNGVPTGLYSELVDDTDTGASPSPPADWTKATCSAGTNGCETYQYETDAAGSGGDSFTWNLDVPADGNYTVYVKYPVVSGAATNAQYTVKYGGGSSTATVTVDQTSDNGGDWVSLGKWAFTKGVSGQQVSLAQNSGGTVVAGAVEIVRDDSGDTNTATHTYTYTYDADGNQTGIADSSPAAAVTNYAMAYDQMDRATSVEEDNSAGTAVHTTTYGYDAASNLTSRTHDGAPSSYAYNDLNQLSTETDKTSSSDPNPQVTSFTYTPNGQVATATKPNGNTVTSTYYASNLPFTVTEDTSGGTLVSSHAYQYDPNGNQTQDAEKLMSANDSSSYLSHTLAYTYDPMDQVTTVSTDGTVTESYTHDAENNVTEQTVNGTKTSYDFVLGRLESATANGSTSDYNYDPFGRLDTVTNPGGQIQQQNTYDGFDNLTATSQLTSTGSTDTTSYSYDSLDRMTSQTTAAGTTTFSFLGVSSQVASESDPGGSSKTYDYTPRGARLSQTATSGGTSSTGYYSYNAHGDVEALTDGNSGDTTATYGYTAYGDPVMSMFTGKDQSDANPSSSGTTQPYSSYRFNAMRWDSASGSYDMGFRNYDPGLNQFESKDMYDGALNDVGLSADPFTGSPYAFGNGNPVTNTEYNGHGGITSVWDSAVSGLEDAGKATLSGLETAGEDIGGALSDLPGAVSETAGFFSRFASIAGDFAGYAGVAWAFLNGIGINSSLGDSGSFTKTGSRPNYSNSRGRLITQQADQEWESGNSGSLAPNNNEDERNCSVGSSWAYYMPLDSQGRAQGAIACLTAGGFNYTVKGGLRYSNDSLIVGSSASVNPAGWVPGMDRGHLLGRQLGGAGNDLRNLVPLYPVPNQTVMRGIENQIAGLIQGGATVFYTATPTYDGTSLIPSSVAVSAFQITPDGPLPIALPNGGIVLNTPPAP